MAINCTLRKTSGVLHELDKAYVKILAAHKIDSETFVNYLLLNEQESGARVKGALAAVVSGMLPFLASGHPVEVPELGTFFISMKGSVGTDKEGNPRLENAEIDKITFTPNVKFRRKLQDLTSFRLIDNTVRSNTALSREKSLEIIRELHDETAVFTADSFRRKAGISYSYAAKILKGLADEGVLTRTIAGHTNIYSLA